MTSLPVRIAPIRHVCEKRSGPQVAGSEIFCAREAEPIFGNRDSRGMRTYISSGCHIVVVWTESSQKEKRFQFDRTGRPTINFRSHGVRVRVRARISFWKKIRFPSLKPLQRPGKVRMAAEDRSFLTVSVVTTIRSRCDVSAIIAQKCSEWLDDLIRILRGYHIGKRQISLKWMNEWMNESAVT